MNILILGATGATGVQLVQQALAKGHEVTAMVREPGKVAARPQLTVVKGNVTSTAEVAAALRGHEAVLSTLGPRAKTDPICALAAEAVVTAMKQEGVKRLIWLSASGVGDSRAPIDKASFVFGRIIIPLLLARPYANHLRAEEIVRASELEWTVLRPLQLVDAPTGKPAVAVATTPTAMLGGLKIARQDLATFMLGELEARAWLQQMPMVHA